MSCNFSPAEPDILQQRYPLKPPAKAVADVASLRIWTLHLTLPCITLHFNNHQSLQTKMEPKKTKNKKGPADKVTELRFSFARVQEDAFAFSASRIYSRNRQRSSYTGLMPSPSSSRLWTTPCSETICYKITAIFWYLR